MISKAFILPTGNEIKDGTVLDLDCPKILEKLVKLNPEMVVVRQAPVVDVEKNIVEAMRRCVEDGAELIVLVGGSGGGHRFSPTLGKDYTHSAMEQWLDRKSARQIYGKNGHMWTNLVCGMKGDCLVVNVPGPLREAEAAIEAFAQSVEAGRDIPAINRAMTEAVFAQYPQDKVLRNE
ncbi:molybdopterin-binding protein [uncultured Oscillibacter sp.]|jgi:hypothetical protein|uniref:molybdopterin-binding protein n=1 Tax=uncultured Oscillibacter sp. TaxID=876091 RepID=UPI002637F782|nr:molybdopterin-binding protein [uncultured Oscillibacter sp.]